MPHYEQTPLFELIRGVTVVFHVARHDKTIPGQTNQEIAESGPLLLKVPDVLRFNGFSEVIPFPSEPA